MDVTIPLRLFLGLRDFPSFTIESINFTLKNFSGLLHFTGFDRNWTFYFVVKVANLNLMVILRN